ncbi:MAG: hypothetical protein HZA23_04475 [Nitrospirae bacterium]|nr:hypothetical protein [Nitrospirota bacterium]
MKKETTLHRSVTEVRKDLTRLDKILKVGETVEVYRRKKPYARIELVGIQDPYDHVLEAIKSLPEPSRGRRRAVAELNKRYRVRRRMKRHG